MSLTSWLKIGSPKSGSKRKLPEESDKGNESPSKRKFSKELNQDSFDWYIKDDEGKWHCTLCRNGKFDIPYARGHDQPRKTTNHARHSSCK